MRYTFMSQWLNDIVRNFPYILICFATKPERCISIVPEMLLLHRYKNNLLEMAWNESGK